MIANATWNGAEGGRHSCGLRRANVARRRALAAAGALAMLAMSPAAPSHANSLPVGRKAITLVAADGSRTMIGHVTFSPEGAGTRIEVKLDAPGFTEEFLSMRPFRCLSPPKQMWCHLDYPYRIENRITVGDLADLEYRLMFIWRTYDRVGADAWNGLYFKLALNGDGSISGPLHEADYNVLAVPPAPEVTRPVTHGDISTAQPGQHAFSAVEIR